MKVRQPGGSSEDVSRLSWPADQEMLTWLVQNVSSGPGAFIRSHEIGDLLYYFTGVSLTDAQVQEALLLLGIEPWDTAPEDWVYRVHKDCPCASMALDGEGGIKTVDRSLYCVSLIGCHGV